MITIFRNTTSRGKLAVVDLWLSSAFGRFEPPCLQRDHKEKRACRVLKRTSGLEPSPSKHSKQLIEQLASVEHDRRFLIRSIVNPQ